MTECATLLVDEVLPREPIRQWVLALPFPLRSLFAVEPVAMSQVLAIVCRAIAIHLIRKAGLTPAQGQTGAVTLIQRFGRAPPPTPAELEAILERITDRFEAGVVLETMPPQHLSGAMESRPLTSSFRFPSLPSQSHGIPPQLLKWKKRHD